jgi:hypothetical protein
MKTVTIEIPDDANTAKVIEVAQRAANPNWIALWWHTDDVLSNDGDEESDLTEDECREILRLADAYHDADNGISWGTLTHWTDHIKDQRGQE